MDFLEANLLNFVVISFLRWSYILVGGVRTYLIVRIAVGIARYRAPPAQIHT